jgi:hypothetical protein
MSEIKYKQCPQCHTDLPLTFEYFYRSSTTKSGFRSWCKVCENKSNLGYDLKHKTARSKRVVKSRNRSEESKARHTSNVINNRSKNKENHYDSVILRKYNICLDDYDKMLIEQDNKCAICFEPIGRICKTTHVDHCHTTFKVRGLLCDRCNLGLGNFKDNVDSLKSAIVYLNKNNEV